MTEPFSVKASPKTEKFILDATAGFRMMWFNKQHPNCIYLDQRPECEPDIIGDFRDLKQFPDETFQLVIFDPPHLLDRWQNRENPFTKYYGLLNAETWQSDLKNGFQELWRILKPKGVLLFKWSDHDKKIEQVISVLPFQPLIAEETTNRLSKRGLNKTLWFCFMKIPKEEGV